MRIAWIKHWLRWGEAGMSQQQDGHERLPADRRYGLLLVLILILALLLRLIFFLNESIIWSDGVYYANLGERLALGEGLPTSRDGVDGNMAWGYGLPEAYYPPGYPLAIAAALRLGVSNSESAGRVVSFLMSLVTVALLAVIGRQIYGPSAGLAAAFLGAIYPPFIRKATEVMSEATYMAAWLGAVAFLLAGLRVRRPGYLAIAGLLTGVAYLIRPEGAALLICLIVIVVEGVRLGWSHRLVVACTVLFILSASLIASPYLLYLSSEAGSLNFSAKTYIALRWGEKGLEDEAARDKMLFSLAPDGEIRPPVFTDSMPSYFHDHWRELVKRYIRNLYDEYWMLSRFSFSFLLIALIGIGLAWPPWDWARVRLESFCLLLLTPLMVFPLFWVTDRFLIPSAVIFLLWAGRGVQQVERLASQAASSLRSWMIKCALIIMLFTTTALPFLVRPLFEPPEIHTELRTVGEWINTNLPSDMILLSRSVQIPYYAKRRAFPIPYASMDDIIRYGKKHGASVLAIEESLVAGKWPQLQQVLAGPLPTELELRHVEGTRLGRRVFIFKFR